MGIVVNGSRIEEAIRLESQAATTDALATAMVDRLRTFAPPHDWTEVVTALREAMRNYYVIPREAVRREGQETLTTVRGTPVYTGLADDLIGVLNQAFSQGKPQGAQRDILVGWLKRLEQSMALHDQEQVYAGPVERGGYLG